MLTRWYLWVESELMGEDDLWSVVLLIDIIGVVCPVTALFWVCSVPECQCLMSLQESPDLVICSHTNSGPGRLPLERRSPGRAAQSEGCQLNIFLAASLSPILVARSLTDGICHLCSWEYPQPITSPASLSASLSRTRDIIGHRATQMSFIFTCFQTFIAFLCKCYDSMDSLPISYEKTTITNSDVTFLTGKCLSGST